METIVMGRRDWEYWKSRTLLFYSEVKFASLTRLRSDFTLHLIFNKKLLSFQFLGDLREEL